MNKKRGRPLKYFDEEIKIETRRKQNRVNQRRHRAMEKIKSEIEETEKSKKWNTQYRNNIVKYFNQFDFDYFFTGTINPTKSEKMELKNINKDIRELMEYLNADFSYKTKINIGFKSFSSYSKKYVEFLFEKNCIERCFYVIEEGKNNNYHIHIMMKSNDNVVDFVKFTEKSWLIGSSLTLSINKSLGQLPILNYCVKELNPSSNNEINKLKIDNWFFEGNFGNKNTLPTIKNVGQIDKNEIAWK